MARLAVFAHIWPMANRPCKPDADLKRLWRVVLPNTPFPPCGVPEDSDAAADEDVRPVTDLRDDAEPRANAAQVGARPESATPAAVEMFLSEYDRWETRYAASEYAFGKDPNYFLASCKTLLPASGRALAVADGEGRNGVWLAEQGLDVLSIDFSPSAQKKARALAAERHVNVAFELVDVHTWDYPEAAFNVVVEIFTQFSSPPERAVKWAGMRRALKPGGLLIIQGYTPKQLEYGTGGPKQAENLYTRAMLEQAFVDFCAMKITEEEREIHEGTSHSGMSAVINFTARKP